MNLLAISGSLRAVSINSALLRAACRLAPAGVAIELFTGLGELPIFNPDLEDRPPVPVTRFRAQVAAADALVIASPEYAHGVTGAIKNGLDWLVSHEPFAGKAVAVWNASPRAHHADDALRETLATMAAAIIGQASVTIPLLGSGLDEEGMVNTPLVAQTIRASLERLCEAVRTQRAAEGVSFPLR